MVFSILQRAELVDNMLSPQVQVRVAASVEEVEARLTSEQVAEVFTKHVPGVCNFLFRQQPGQFALSFVQMAYRDGFRAFKGTALENHLKWLLRIIVHYGYDGEAEASQFLTDVAEAFMDCQAVQARVVERIGLQILGVTTNFRGLVMALLGEYKTVALKMLAYERISQGNAHDDATPTHYENRLTEDIGNMVGLNADDVRRAALDEHARARYRTLSGTDAQLAAIRCRQLFDLDAFVRALVSELNSFNAESPTNSLPRLFLDWASQNLSEKHVVFDEETCTRVELDTTFVMAILEVLFRDRLVVLAEQEYRGMQLRDIFISSPQCNSISSAPQTAPTVTEPLVKVERPLDDGVLQEALQVSGIAADVVLDVASPEKHLATAPKSSKPIQQSPSVRKRSTQPLLRQSKADRKSVV